MTKVKICGITRLKDAFAAARLGADYLGFVFYKKSPRHISPHKAKVIISFLPSQTSAVGVFVNDSEDNVKRISDYCGLKELQFHGDETPQYCRRFKGYKIIKAFRVKDKNSLKNLNKFKVSAFLFDAFDKKGFGGTGKTFNWPLIKPFLKTKTPIILSGGINPGNIQSAIKKVSPYAVDISSGVEISPGIKSRKLMKKLFLKISQIDSSRKKPHS